MNNYWYTPPTIREKRIETQSGLVGISYYINRRKQGRWEYWDQAGYWGSRYLPTSDRHWYSREDAEKALTEVIR